MSLNQKIAFKTYESSCVALMLWWGVGHRKLVSHFGVMRGVLWKVWFLVSTVIN